MLSKEQHRAKKTLTKRQQDFKKNNALRNKIDLIRVRDKGLSRLTEEDIKQTKTKITVETIKSILQRILMLKHIESTEVLNRIEAYSNNKKWIASEEFHMALEKLRQQINQLDDELLTVLSTRMKVAQKIGEYKKNNDITILQTNRWNEILERAVAKGNKMGLSDDFITKYMDAVHMESIQQQNKIMNS